MSILNNAKQHFRDRLAGGLKMIEVPEWADKKGNPAKIYYKPSMNFIEQQSILKYVNEGKQAEAVVMTLIVRAVDENGKKLFAPAERQILMREIDPDVISAIVAKMGAEELDEDLDVKN